MRGMGRLSRRELVRPRVKACRHTELSVKWKSLVLHRHRRLVRIARSSRPLMCSFWLAHFEPHTTFHFQHCAGTVALNLWDLTICVPGVVSKMSSPLTEIKFPSLAASLAD